MALMTSVALKFGTSMPPFELDDPSGKRLKSEELRGPRGLLVAFTCNHCPYAIAVWPRLIELAKKAKALGINTVGINPNIHPDYPDDAPERMKEKIEEWGIPFPYLIDRTQEVARAYCAQCTPDLYLYDAGKRLVYHGRFDDNWKDASQVRRRDLQDAVEALAAGRPVSGDQKPSMGCSIKWR